MKHPVDIDNWNRRENYLFFRDFANPYYSVTSQVDVTEAYIRAKALGIKFSHYAMYASLRAVNSIEALRYRQVDGKVWLYDRIRLNTAVAREDHSLHRLSFPIRIRWRSLSLKREGSLRPRCGAREMRTEPIPRRTRLL